MKTEMLIGIGFALLGVFIILYEFNEVARREKPRANNGSKNE